jgi:hypothetical protein
MDASRFDSLTRRLAGGATRRTALGSALGAALAGFGLDPAVAQDATPDSSPAADETPVFMFVQTFTAGRGEVNPGAGTPVADGTPTPGGGASLLLTLEGHGGQTIYFSDRIVGAAPTTDFLEGLGFSPANPPNGALVAEFASGQGVVVLELIEPVYTPDTGTLTYGAEVLEGYEGETLGPVLADQVAARLPAAFGPASLFIDACADLTTCWCADRTYLGDIPVGSVAMIWDFKLFGCVVKSLDEYQTAKESCWQAYGGGDCPDRNFIKLGRSDMIQWEPSMP